MYAATIGGGGAFMPLEISVDAVKDMSKKGIENG